MQQGGMPAQGNMQQQNQMQAPGPGMIQQPQQQMQMQMQQQNQMQPQMQQMQQGNGMPGAGMNQMGQHQQFDGRQAPPMQSNAQMQHQLFQHEDAKLNRLVQDSMRTISCQMLDGTTQDYPFIVAKQLEEQGLCKMAPEPVMANNGAGQGMAYNQVNQVNQGMMMNGQQQMQPGMAMPMNNPYMAGMSDEMVELELPNGEIRMVTKSQAEQMGCVPVPDYPPQQQQQPIMAAEQSSLYNMGRGNMGGGVPIGPAVIVDQGPDYGRTISVANINMTQQMGVTVPIQSTMSIMQPHTTFVQPQSQTMRRSMTLLQPGISNTMSVVNPMGMAPMPTNDVDPLVRVILPSGETQMMPKSQALQLQEHLQMGGGPQAMPNSPGYGAGNAYQNDAGGWSGYGASPPAVPWGQDIGDM